MKNQRTLRIAGLWALLSASLVLPGCVSYEDYGNGGYGSYYSGGYYGDPYWASGPWYIYDDDDDHHHHGDGNGDYNRPGRPSHPVAPPERGQRPSQLPSRSIPAPAPRPSMGGGGRGGGGGGGRGGRR